MFDIFIIFRLLSLFHENVMKNSKKEKYLGDYITEKANSKDTIEDRKARGNAVLSSMTALLSDIPLGRRRIEAGLALRKAWFLNGCLFNSEVWIGFSPQDLHDLEVLDHKILRLIIGAQAKAPTEMLYLETSQLPIRNVISARRVSYYHTIMRRPKNELIREVFSAMKEEPTKGDWIHLLKEDLIDFGIDIENEAFIESLSKEQFKNIVKKKAREIAWKQLEETKS